MCELHAAFRASPSALSLIFFPTPLMQHGQFGSQQILLFRAKKDVDCAELKMTKILHKSFFTFLFSIPNTLSMVQQAIGVCGNVRSTGAFLRGIH